MGSVGFLFRVDAWVVALSLLAACFAMSELAYRMSRRTAAAGRSRKDHYSSVQAMVAALLGLLLAFTVSMAVSRFESRKAAVVNESNAIGTAFLRVALLPEPEQSRAVEAIRDYIDRSGSVDGKRLSDHFGDAPFGWSPDTLRYVVAAMLLAGEIKLKAAGREVTVNGQQAIDALKTNNSFKSVGVSLRGGDRPSNEMLARAAARLTELIGDTVVPLEDDISRKTTRLFPQLQHQYAPLAEKLRSLQLPGDDRLRSLNQEIADVLLTDASDAPRRLGAEESELFDSLKWAAELKLKLEQGMEQTLRDLRQHCNIIANLPDVDLLAQLKDELAEALNLIQERLQQADFYRCAADFNTSLTTIRARIRDTVISMQELIKQRIKDAEVDLRRVPEWIKLTQQEQSEVLGDLERLTVQIEPNLAGLTTIHNKDYELQSKVQELKRRIEKLGRQRIKEEMEHQQAKEDEVQEPKQPIARSLSARTQITTLEDLDALIQQLQHLRGELKYAHAFALSLKLDDN